MEALAAFHGTHPLWFWIAVSAAILAVEVALGTGWLLWPAATAALVGVLTALVPMSPALAVLIFAVLTIITTLAGRKLMPRSEQAAGGDINDPQARLVGQKGRTATAFVQGEGRALVDGKEWPATLEGGGALDVGAQVEVTGFSGSRLTVRAAGLHPPGAPATP